MDITLFAHAQRYVGIREIVGTKDHPLIQWWLSLCGFDLDVHDEVAWCAAFKEGMCWDLNIPRTKSAAARMSLTIGTPTNLADAMPAWDVVVLKRGKGEQPGPDVLDAPGHVGFFAGWHDGQVLILGGNQQNGVLIEGWPIDQILGIRRLG